MSTGGYRERDMAGRKRKKKNRNSGIAVILLAVFCLMAFSLSVRWFGIGRIFSRESEQCLIEVLNGTGEPGVAGKATLELRRIFSGEGRQFRIDVRKEGNAERFDFRESLLIDRRGNPALMRKLSRLLGCRRVLVQVQDRPEVDVTLIIGWDHDKLKI